MVSAETQLLYLCTRQDFLPHHSAQLQTIVCDCTLDWEAVFDGARLHGVAPLVGRNLQQVDVPLPAAVVKRFKMMTMRNMTEKRRRSSALGQALDAFSAHGLAVMPVKGAALDVLVYDQMWYTTSDDIDIVFALPNEAALAPELVQILPTLVDAHVEYDYHTHHDITMNATLGVDFDRIWRDSMTGEWENRPIRLMSWEDMLIALCINSCRKRFFRLKALCDVAETVNRGATRLDWELFLAKTRDYGCAAIVYAALLATQVTLGCAVPDEVVDALPVGVARRRTIRRLVTTMSPEAFDSIFTGKQVFGRNLDTALMLQYTTLSWRQLGRKMRFVWRTRDNESLPSPRPG